MGLIADIHKDLEKGAVQLLVEYRGRLHAEALRLCSDPSSAEDLVFRTLEQAIFKIDTFKGEGDLYGWMKSIMTNLHLNDGIRAVNRGTSPASQEELEKLAGECNVTVDELIRNSDSEVLREAIDRLDPEYKRVIVMHYYENLSFKQIAAVLNAPVGTVLWRANMARKLLGKKLRAQLGDSKPKLAVLAALMLAGSLFGAWGIVEAVSSAADEEPVAAESALGSLESEGSLGSLGTGADTIDPNPDTVDPNPDPIVSNSDYIVPNPDPIVPKDSIPAEQISTTENTEKEDTMNLKSITQTTAKLAVGALLTTGLAANAAESEAAQPNAALAWFTENQFGVAPIGKPTDLVLGENTIQCAGGAITITLQVNLPPGASADHPVPVFVLGELTRQNKILANVPIDTLLSHGYAFVCYNFNDVAPNADPKASESAWHQGVFDVYGPETKTSNSWGTISAWAWGFSRVMDWIESRPELDSTRVAVVGHSRGGKTALWAGAQDSRIAMAVSSCSGCCGAQQLRLKVSGSEKVADILGNYSFWFCKNLAQWSGREEDLPYDGADLIGLMKGRLAYVSSGSEDVWAGPTAETAAVELARTAGTTVGRHIHDGIHELSTYDWLQYVDFADDNLKGKEEDDEQGGDEGAKASEPPKYKVEMTVSGYDGESTLKDFPVLVKLSTANIRGFLYSMCATDGSDLQFTQNGKTCPCEIERWDPEGTSYVWVRMKELAKDSKFTMWFGGSAAENDSTQTWARADGGYVGVWHMDEATGTVKDATGHGLHATPSTTGYAQSVAYASGAVGNARQISTSATSPGPRLTVPNYDSLNVGSTFTASAWVRLNGNASYDSWPRIFSRKTSSADENGWEVHASKTRGSNSTTIFCQRSKGSGHLRPYCYWKANEWIHMSFVYDGTTLSAYVNGRKVTNRETTGEGTIQAATDNGKTLALGAGQGSEWSLCGYLDEVRLLDDVVTDDWAAAEYASMAEEGFLTAGEVVALGDDKLIVATLQGCDIYEDDEAHGATLTVTDPAEGYSTEWAVGDGAYSSEQPTFTTAGNYTVRCRVSCDGYVTAEYSTKVVINLREFNVAAENVYARYDGMRRGILVKVTDEPEGCVREWSVDGVSFGLDELKFSDAGKHVAYCRLSCQHYMPKTVSAAVMIWPDAMYASSSGSAEPPYDTEAKASHDLPAIVALANELGAENIKIFLSPGEYAIPSKKLEVAHGFELIGPTDRSAVIRQNGMKLSEKANVSGLTFDSVSSSSIHVGVGSVVSNCLFKGTKNPVRLSGLLVDSVVTEFGKPSDSTNSIYGVYIESSSALISRCEISKGFCKGPQNESRTGAVFSELKSCAARIEDTKFLFNTNIAAFGSTICYDDAPSCPAYLNRCTFIGNAGRFALVRLSMDGGNRQPLYATNCLFVANDAITLEKWFPSAGTSKVGVFFCSGELVNCTLVDNVGGYMFHVNSDKNGYNVRVVDCILQDNIIDTWEDITGSKPTGVMRNVSYSLWPDASGEGNIAGPAKFLGSGTDPYRLAVGSPGIDAGTNLGWERSDTDLRGRRRWCGRCVDMGCYEVGIGSMLLIQ